MRKEKYNAFLNEVNDGDLIMFTSHAIAHRRIGHDAPRSVRLRPGKSVLSRARGYRRCLTDPISRQEKNAFDLID